MKMQISKVKATLLKFASVNRRFSKIKAALPANTAPGISEQEIENRVESFPTYETAKEYRTAQLEAQAHIAALSHRRPRQAK